MIDPCMWIRVKNGIRADRKLRLTRQAQQLEIHSSIGAREQHWNQVGTLVLEWLVASGQWVSQSRPEKYFHPLITNH